MVYFALVRLRACLIVIWSFMYCIVLVAHTTKLFLLIISASRLVSSA